MTSPNELVDWFNQVDATYKSDLRELNELNFARCEARLEGEIAQAVAQLEARMAAFEARGIKRNIHFMTRAANAAVRAPRWATAPASSPSPLDLHSGPSLPDSSGPQRLRVNC